MNKLVSPVSLLALAMIAVTCTHATPAPTPPLRPCGLDDVAAEPCTQAIPAPTPPPPTAAPAASAPTAPASMEVNKSLVRRYVEQVLIGGHFEVFDELVSPTYKRYLSATATPLTPQGQKQRLAGMRAAFPDMQVTIDDLFANGDRVAYRLTIRATHQGAFQSIAPTGKAVTVAALEIVRIENGKLVEHWGGPDTLSLLQQLGAVVSAGPEKE